MEPAADRREHDPIQIVLGEDTKELHGARLTGGSTCRETGVYVFPRFLLQ